MRAPCIRLCLALLLIPAIACGREKPAAADWRSALEQESLDESAFTSAFAALVRERSPGTEVRIDGPLELTVERDDKPVRCFLQNAWALCADSPSERAEVCERYADSLLDTGRDSARGMDSAGTDAIVPMLKSRRWFDETAAMAPDDPIHAEPFVADLLVVYVLDLPDSMQFLTRSDVERLELSGEELRALSVMNLRGRLPEVLQHGNEKFSMLVAGGNYEASLLLFDDLWPERAAACEGELVVAIPARDLLYVSDSGNSEAMKALDEALAEARTGAYLLSEAKLRWAENRWQPLEE